jgi:hypothetical protein
MRPASKVGATVTSLVWKNKLEKDKGQNLKHYRSSGFEETREFLRLALQRTDLCRGIMWLIKLRGRAIWTGPRAARAGLVNERLHDECPSCGENCREDVPHILLECNADVADRAEHIQPLVEGFAGPASALQRDELAALILGGQVSGAEHRQEWLGKATHSRWNDRPPFLRVAEFLQRVMPRRMGRLWRGQSPQTQPRDPVSRFYNQAPNHIVEVVIPLAPDRTSQSPHG